MADFTLSELVEIIKNLERDKFWGELELFWQAGKVKSFKLISTHKKTEENNSRPRSVLSGLSDK